LSTSGVFFYTTCMQQATQPPQSTQAMWADRYRICL